MCWPGARNEIWKAIARAGGEGNGRQWKRRFTIFVRQNPFTWRAEEGRASFGWHVSAALPGDDVKALARTRGLHEGCAMSTPVISWMRQGHLRVLFTPQAHVGLAVESGSEDKQRRTCHRFARANLRTNGCPLRKDGMGAAPASVTCLNRYLRWDQRTAQGPLLCHRTNCVKCATSYLVVSPGSSCRSLTSWSFAYISGILCCSSISWTGLRYLAVYESSHAFCAKELCQRLRQR